LCPLGVALDIRDSLPSFLGSLGGWLHVIRVIKESFLSFLSFLCSALVFSRGLGVIVLFIFVTWLVVITVLVLAII
jgi:hypothetical protein